MIDDYNPILDVDSYKLSHFCQYPPGTQYISSYIEARSGKVLPNTEFFGLQYYLKRYLSVRVTWDHIEEAEPLVRAHGLPFNREGWEHIVRNRDGIRPVQIFALPEGDISPIGTCLAQIVNTDPVVPWLTSYTETSLLRSIWYPTTVASLSRECKNTIKGYLDDTCDDPDSVINFALHDFGARGVSSLESAGIGGAAHIINFMGTDTVEAIRVARKYYGADMPAFSIPAAEHSTITSWGRHKEVDAYRNMLKFDGLVAVVSDSYDIYNAVDNIWGKELKEEVLARGGRVVIRPDSGKPSEVVLRVVQSLSASFGYTTNNKGYKVLHPAVRVLQGDGINKESIREILQVLKDDGFSAENVVFGMGGKLLQGVDRDTMAFAMKENAICINGVWHDVFKDPQTDSGKKSKAGVQMVIRPEPGSPLQTVRYQANSPYPNQLQEVWRNGQLLADYSFEEIRQRAAAGIYGLPQESLIAATNRARGLTPQ